MRGTINSIFTQANFTPSVSYSWDFGNGTKSDQLTASTVYTTAGTYTITLIMQYNPINDRGNVIQCGTIEEATATITVTEG